MATNQKTGSELQSQTTDPDISNPWGEERIKLFTFFLETTVAWEVGGERGPSCGGWDRWIPGREGRNLREACASLMAAEKASFPAAPAANCTGASGPLLPSYQSEGPSERPVSCPRCTLPPSCEFPGVKGCHGQRFFPMGLHSTPSIHPSVITECFCLLTTVPGATRER